MFQNQKIDYKSIQQLQPVSFDLGFVIESNELVNTYQYESEQKYHILVRTTDGSEVQVKPASNSFLQIPVIGEHVLIFQGYRSNSNFVRRRRQWYYWPLYPIQGDVNENSLPQAFGPKRSDDETADVSDNDSLGSTFQAESVPGLQPFEGDTIFQGRFGNTIRLGSSQGTSNRYSNQHAWSSENGSPIIILSNSTQRDIQGYRVENIQDDASSLWLTSNQSLSGVIDLSKSLSTERESVGAFNKSQLIGSADRVILQAKQDSVVIDSAEDVVILTKQLFLGKDNATIPMTNTLKLKSILERLISALLIGGTDIATGAPVRLNGRSQISRLLGELESLKINKFKIEK